MLGLLNTRKKDCKFTVTSGLVVLLVIRLVPTGVGTDPRRSVPTRLPTRAGR